MLWRRIRNAVMRHRLSRRFWGCWSWSRGGRSGSLAAALLLHLVEAIFDGGKTLVELRDHARVDCAAAASRTLDQHFVSDQAQRDDGHHEQKSQDESRPGTCLFRRIAYKRLAIKFDAFTFAIHIFYARSLDLSYFVETDDG